MIFICTVTTNHTPDYHGFKCSNDLSARAVCLSGRQLLVLSPTEAPFTIGHVHAGTAYFNCYAELSTPLKKEITKVCSVIWRTVKQPVHFDTHWLSYDVNTRTNYLTSARPATGGLPVVVEQTDNPDLATVYFGNTYSWGLARSRNIKGWTCTTLLHNVPIINLGPFKICQFNPNDPFTDGAVR